MAEATTTELDKELDREAADDAKSIHDWLTTFGSGANIRLSLYRKHPQNHKGFPCGGKIDSFEGTTTEDEIAEIHGGGKYQIIVHRPNPNAAKKGQPSMLFGGARTFQIAGHPKLDNLEGYEPQKEERAGGNGHDSNVTTHAMSMAEKMARDAQDRADRLERDRGNGLKDIEVVLAPMRDQMAALRDELSRKDERITELLGRKPDTSTQDQLVSLYKDSNTDHSNRLQEIRLAHDAELRQLRQSSNDDMKRREGRFERELDAVRESHKREIETLKHSHQIAMDSTKNGYETRIEALKESRKVIDRQLTEARAEVVALRAKKEVGPVESLTSLVALKGQFDALMPAPPEPPSEPAGWERALDKITGVVTKIPAVQNAAMNALGAGAPAGAEQLVALKRPDGTVVHVPRAQAEAIMAQQAAEKEQGQEEAESDQGMSDEEYLEDIGDDEIAAAVGFIETAYRNGMDPAVVGSSARNLVPAGILTLLKKRGVDHFLNNVAQLEDSSPLSTIEGRMYMRQIAKFLLEGTTDDTPQPEEAPPSNDETTIPDASGAEEAPGEVELDIDEPDSPVETE